jgi:hypothetical protein
MAEPLSPAPVASGGSIELMEQAVGLLRQAPLSTLLCHWLGSAPLALALLVFRNQVARPRVPASTAALYALLLTLLLIWMNCWRAIFSGRLRRQLSGAADSPWTAGRVFRLIALQAYFGATKLFILPLAALIMFTFADTVAFYRIATVLAAGDANADTSAGADPLRLRSRARQLAAFAGAQNWTILAILFLLQVVTAINLTLAIAALPQLFRILTGIETAFSRSGWVFVVNPLFPFLVMAVTWLALDPFVQAVYCVRCFRAESIETGEDVRAGLRRIRAARHVVNAAAVLFFLVVPGSRLGRAADSAVSPNRLEQAIKQTMQSHEYDWRLPPPADSVRGHSWILDATDRAVAGLRSVFHSIGKAIAAFFKWLLRQFGAMPEPGPGAPPVKALHWSVYLLIGLVLAFALWIAWQKRRARRAKAAHVAADSVTAVRLDSEDLTPDRLPEEQWLELAARCLAEQNFRLALRAYYLANLAWLGRTGFIGIHSGKTNREYELELRRKSRAFPEARGLFATNVAAFERAWYGVHEVAVEDTGEFLNRMERIKAVLGVPQEAAA